MYVCVDCSHPLFSSRCKYNHHTPWPAFTHTIRADSVTKVPEEGRDGALKVSCGKCGAGLGHEFLKAGPDGETSRFWIFSNSLKFISKEGEGVGQLDAQKAVSETVSWKQSGSCNSSTCALS